MANNLAIFNNKLDIGFSLIPGPVPLAFNFYPHLLMGYQVNSLVVYAGGSLV